MSGEAVAALQRALAISHELCAIAEHGDVGETANLDAERRRLLESVRSLRAELGDEERQLLARIAHLNDRSIGSMEHRLRAVARDMDMAVVGRKALSAYSATRSMG